MRLQIDETLYHLNLTKVSAHLQAWYNEHKYESDVLQMGEGKTTDFSRGSIPRLALKAALTPVALPAMRMLYALKGAEPPQHKKHEDLIDYCILALLGFIALLDEGYLYGETLEGAGHNQRIINSLSTHEPTYIGSGGGERESTGTEAESSTGGQTFLHSGQNGYGQDQTGEGDHQEEN
jgi:hypothetical protein